MYVPSHSHSAQGLTRGWTTDRDSRRPPPRKILSVAVSKRVCVPRALEIALPSKVAAKSAEEALAVTLENVQHSKAVSRTSFARLSMLLKRRTCLCGEHTRVEIVVRSKTVSSNAERHINERVRLRENISHTVLKFPTRDDPDLRHVLTSRQSGSRVSDETFVDMYMNDIESPTLTSDEGRYRRTNNIGASQLKRRPQEW
jgi:hypothetical protein